MNNSEIIRRILEAASADAFTAQVSKSVDVGQIRLLSHSDRGRGGQIVVIAKVEPWAETAEVILLNNLIELATPRDFILISSENGNSFDAAIWSDFYGSVEYMQLIDNPVLGSMCEICVKSILTALHNPLNDVAEIAENHTCFYKGQYQPLVNEEVWHMRNAEFSSFFEKTIYLSQIQIAARQASNSSFQNTTQQSDLVRNSKKEQLTVEAIDELDDLALCLVRI